MIFKDLLDRVDFHQIQFQLMKCYEVDEFEECQELLDFLKDVKPFPNNVTIHIKRNHEFDDVDVYGTNGERYSSEDGVPQNLINKEKKFALEFSRFSDWLGMTICKHAFNHFSEDEIATHCLFEMSFISSDPEKIDIQANALDQALDLFLDSRKKSSDNS